MLSAAVIAVIGIFVVSILYSAVRILREYERGVVFTLGRYTGTKGPGFFLLVPLVQQMVRADLRVMVDEVPPQDVISHDNACGCGPALAATEVGGPRDPPTLSLPFMRTMRFFVYEIPMSQPFASTRFFMAFTPRSARRLKGKEQTAMARLKG